MRTLEGPEITAEAPGRVRTLESPARTGTHKLEEGVCLNVGDWGLLESWAGGWSSAGQKGEELN